MFTFGAGVEAVFTFGPDVESIELTSALLSEVGSSATAGICVLVLVAISATVPVGTTELGISEISSSGNENVATGGEIS